MLAIVEIAATLNGLNGGNSDHRLMPFLLAMGSNAHGATNRESDQTKTDSTVDTEPAEGVAHFLGDTWICSRFDNGGL